MKREIDLELIFESRKTANKFGSLETKLEKLTYLLKGYFYIAKMINNKTLKEYYRPKLNGVIVMDSNNESIFTTKEEVFKERDILIEHIKELCISEINKTNE